MFKVAKKAFQGVAEGYAPVQAAVNAYGNTSYKVSADEMLTDELCRNLVSFLEECGRKDVRYDPDTKYTWISGAPCLFYVLYGANNSGTAYSYKSVGIEFPFRLGFAASPTQTPTSSATVAFSLSGSFTFVAGTGAYTMSFKFIGTETGPFIIGFGCGWRRTRTSTSSSTWNYNVLTSAYFAASPYSYAGFCHGRNVLTRDRSVFFSYGGQAAGYCVDVGEDGGVDGSFLVAGGTPYHYSINNRYSLAATAGLTDLMGGGKVPLVQVTDANPYSVHEMDCYSHVPGMPDPTSVYEDSASLFTVGGRSFWVNRISLQVQPGSANAFANHCYNPFFAVVEVTEG